MKSGYSYFTYDEEIGLVAYARSRTLLECSGPSKRRNPVGLKTLAIVGLEFAERVLQPDHESRLRRLAARELDTNFLGQLPDLSWAALFVLERAKNHGIEQVLSRSLRDEARLLLHGAFRRWGVALRHLGARSEFEELSRLGRGTNYMELGTALWRVAKMHREGWAARLPPGSAIDPSEGQRALELADELRERLRCWQGDDIEDWWEVAGRVERLLERAYVHVQSAAALAWLRSAGRNESDLRSRTALGRVAWVYEA